MFLKNLLTLLMIPALVSAYTVSTISPDDGPVRCEIRDSASGLQYSLAPENTLVNALITDGVAQVHMVQTFVNPFGSRVQASYVFPLPHQGSVHGMTYVTNGMMYSAKIMERAAAQAMFDSIQSAGGIAALLLQLKPNIFSQSLANIGPYDTVKVVIDLSMPLKYTSGTYEFAFPTMVGDRCCNSGTSPIYGTITGWNPPADIDGPRIQFNVAIQSGFDFTNVTSPTHPIDVETFALTRSTLIERGVIRSEADIVQPYTSSVMLLDVATYPNSDFVLQFSRRSQGKTFTSSSFADTSGIRYFMLNMLPDESALSGERGDLDVMLLVDVSGSQAGWPLQKEIEVARNIVSRLRATDRLCLMEFDTYQYVAFPDTMRPATVANLGLADQWLNVDRGGGSTELLQAVQAITSIPNPEGKQRIYVFLTDGFITNEEAILSYLQAQNPVPTVMTFGAGNNLNRYFLDEAAATGGGFSTELTSGTDVPAAVDLAWAKLSSPQLTDISLDFGGMAVFDTLLPSARSLFKGQLFTAYGKTRATGLQTVTLNGKVNGTPVSFQKTINLNNENVGSWVVPKLWAREKIRKLELVDNSGTSRKDSIIQVSVEHQVLSKYTAFLAYQAVTYDASVNLQYSMMAGAALSETKSPRQSLGRFSWAGFQLARNVGEVRFTWDNGAEVEELKVFDLHGNLLFQWKKVQGQASEAVWHANSATQARLMRGNLIVQVKTSQGMLRKVFPATR